MMRHAFALTMAKLHIQLDYPSCDTPSIEELTRMMDRGAEPACLSSAHTC